MASTHKYGRPPGTAEDRQDFGFLDIPGGLKLTSISGGSLTVTDMVDGSDSQDTLTVNSVEVMGSATTWATDDDTTGRAITKKVNAQAITTGIWSTYDAANDKVMLWPRDGGTAAITHTVTGTGTSWTPVYQNMNTGQAYVAAVRMPSWNNGADMFPDTKMYQCSLDFAYLGHASNQSTIASFKGVEMIVRPEDQAVYVYLGFEGLIYCASAVETIINVSGFVAGDIPMFMQAAAATNCAYRFVGW
jgi:hypothetical protein